MVRLKIFISSPDSYSDVFGVFLSLLRKFWKDCPYEIVLSTNSKNYDGITVYKNHLENDRWTDRAIPVLSALDCKYVLLMCDDMLITDKVDSCDIEKILDDMDHLQLNYCKMTGPRTGEPIGESGLLTRVEKNRPYAKNIHVGIYNRLYLLNEIGNGDLTPWELEEKWLKEASEASDEFHEDIVVTNIDIMHAKNSVVKGRWVGSVKKQVESLGICINSNRAELSKREELLRMIYIRFRDIVPSSYRRYIKKLAERVGFKFSSKY